MSFVAGGVCTACTGEGVRVSMTASSRIAGIGACGLATAAILVSWKSGVECVFVRRLAKRRERRVETVEVVGGGLGVAERCSCEVGLRNCAAEP